MASVAGPREDRCFPCKTEFRSVSMMSKRRRIDGVANKTAFCVLDELSQSKFNRKLSSICQELRDEFMCNKCKKKAEELDMLRKRVDSVTKELLDLIGGVLVMEPQRKRSASGSVTDTPPSKRRMIDDSTQPIDDENEEIVSVS